MATFRCLSADQLVPVMEPLLFSSSPTFLSNPTGLVGRSTFYGRLHLCPASLPSSAQRDRCSPIAVSARTAFSNEASPSSLKVRSLLIQKPRTRSSDKILILSHFSSLKQGAGLGRGLERT